MKIVLNPRYVWWEQVQNGGNIQGPAAFAEPAEEYYEHEREDRYFWPPRNVIDVEEMVHNTFARVDKIHAEVFDAEGGEPLVEN